MRNAIELRDEFNYPQDYTSLGYCSHIATYVNKEKLDLAIDKVDELKQKLNLAIDIIENESIFDCQGGPEGAHTFGKCGKCKPCLVLEKLKESE